MNKYATLYISEFEKKAGIASKVLPFFKEYGRRLSMYGEGMGQVNIGKALGPLEKIKNLILYTFHPEEVAERTGRPWIARAQDHLKGLQAYKSDLLPAYEKAVDGEKLQGILAGVGSGAVDSTHVYDQLSKLKYEIPRLEYFINKAQKDIPAATAAAYTPHAIAGATVLGGALGAKKIYDSQSQQGRDTDSSFP